MYIFKIYVMSSHGNKITKNCNMLYMRVNCQNHVKGEGEGFSRQTCKVTRNIHNLYKNSINKKIQSKHHKNCKILTPSVLIPCALATTSFDCLRTNF